MRPFSARIGQEDKRKLPTQHVGVEGVGTGDGARRVVHRAVQVNKQPLDPIEQIFICRSGTLDQHAGAVTHPSVSRAIGRAARFDGSLRLVCCVEAREPSGAVCRRPLYHLPRLALPTLARLREAHRAEAVGDADRGRCAVGGWRKQLGDLRRDVRKRGE
eukprot:scaffold180443_cov31-Tisochrysis_lutea.AAC.1